MGRPENSFGARKIPFAIVFSLVFMCLSCLEQPRARQNDPTPKSPRFFRTFTSPTSERSLVLKGKSEAGTQVKIYRDNILVSETVANQQGDFKSHRIALRVGENRFYAVAVDEQGRQSRRSGLSRSRGREGGRLPLEVVVVRQ